jgi:hypothetical protein
VSWAKFDDRYDDNRKVKRAWRTHPRAVGLHAMSVTYCARHETDGIVDIEWLEDKLPSKVDRAKCLVALLSAGLFERIDDDRFRVHDYLEYNDSHAVLGERRARDAERKARGRAKQSERSPRGRGVDVRAESDGPDPTRPDHKPPSPQGNGVEGKDLDDAKARLKREAAARLDAEFDEWLTDHATVTGHTPPRAGTKARAAVASSFAARREEDYSLDDLKLATRGARHDDYRREHGYDTAESILRPTKIHDLIGKGRRAKTSAGGIDDIVERAERRERLLEQQRREREATGARS